MKEEEEGCFRTQKEVGEEREEGRGEVGGGRACEETDEENEGREKDGQEEVAKDASGLREKGSEGH